MSLEEAWGLAWPTKPLILTLNAVRFTHRFQDLLAVVGDPRGGSLVCVAEAFQLR
jgi:hypothetical protein